jgi:LacI family transcriptional regulator
VSIASFNDNDFAPFLHPPLTTVRLPIREIGEQAGRYLLARFSGEAPPPAHVQPVQLMARKSTGPAPEPRGKGDYGYP